MPTLYHATNKDAANKIDSMGFKPGRFGHQVTHIFPPDAHSSHLTHTLPT
jgi:hypothetical protein